MKIIINHPETIGRLVWELPATYDEVSALTEEKQKTINADFDLNKFALNSMENLLTQFLHLILATKYAGPSGSIMTVIIEKQVSFLAQSLYSLSEEFDNLPREEIIKRIEAFFGMTEGEGLELFQKMTQKKNDSI